MYNQRASNGGCAPPQPNIITIYQILCRLTIEAAFLSSGGKALAMRLFFKVIQKVIIFTNEE